MDQDNNGRHRDKRSYDPTKPYNRPKTLMDRVSKLTSFISPSFLLRMVTPGRGSPHDGHANQPSMSQARNDGMPREYMSSGPPLPDMMSAPALSSFMVPPGAEGASAPDHTNLGTPGTPFSHYKQLQTPVTNGTMGNNCDNESSFLWSPPNTSRHNGPQPAAQIQKPGFQLSAFGTPHLSLNQSGLPQEDYRQSPFYPGKTAFGGASAHRKSRLASASPYEGSPGRRRVKAKPAQNASLSGVSSSTAKLILDTLERMTTPISDAKKIPSYHSSAADSPLSFTPGQYRRKTSLLSSSHPSKSSTGGPPSQQLNCSFQASLATNHYKAAVPPKPTSSQQTPQQQAPMSGQSEPKNQDSSQSTTASIGGGGKMRRERGGHHYSSRGQEEEKTRDDLPPLPLSTSFTLPQLQTPLLDLAPTMASPASTTKQSVTQPTPFSIAAASPPRQLVAGTPNGTDNFKFASPINKSSSDLSMPLPQVDKAFQFSQPLDVKERTSSVSSLKVEPPASQLMDSSSQGFTFSSPNANTKPRIRHPAPADPAPVVSSPSVGIGPAAQLKSGSVMDILGKGSAFGQSSEFSKNGPGFKIGASSGASPFSTGAAPFSLAGKESPAGSAKTTAQFQFSSGTDMKGGSLASSNTLASSSPLSSLFKKAEGSWECPTCMIQNKGGVSKCVACETAKPTAKPPAPSIPDIQPAGSGFGSLFKKPTGSWECPTCMIQNKADVAKCVACEMAKPAEKPPPTSVPLSQPSGPGFGEQFKKPTGSWECPTCMIQNKADVAKCVACETAKPGQKPSASTMSATQFQPIGSGFSDKFKKPTGNWECPTCMVSNTSDTAKCVACTTPKPGGKPAATSATGFQPISSGFGAQFKKPEGSWECPTCMVSNKGDVAKCVACETSKPGQKPAFGISSGFSSPAGFSLPKAGASWTCDTCLVQNKPEANKCIACEASKPGAKPTTGFTSNTGFKFTSVVTTSSGASSPFSAPPKQSSVTQPGFQIGTSTGSSGSQPAGFAISSVVASKSATPSPFGTSVPAASSTSTPSVGFRFNAPTDSITSKDTTASTASSTKDTPAAASQAAVGGFTFGAPVSYKPTELSTPASLAVSTSDPPRLGGTLGGLSSVAADATAPSLTVSSQSSSVTTALTTEVKKQEPSKPTGFVFGVAKTDSPSPFSISSKPTDKPAAAPATTFSFGQKTDSIQFSFGQKPQMPVKPEEKPLGAAPMFNFQPAGGQPPAFSAPTTNAPSTGMFKREMPSEKSDADEAGPAKKKPTFNFGADIGSSAPATGGFKFGVTNSVAPNAASPASFSFSNMASNSGNTSSTPASGFVFGAGSKPLGASEPAAPKPAEPAPSENKSNFTFGQSSSSGGLFQFSANSQNTSAPPSNPGGFNFSTPAASTGTAQTGFNFSASTAATPQFAFGSGPQQPVFGSPAPAGLTAPPAGAFTFNANTSGSTQQSSSTRGRQIKRAVRKLRK